MITAFRLQQVEQAIEGVQLLPSLCKVGVRVALAMKLIIMLNPCHVKCTCPLPVQHDSPKEILGHRL